jgi:hypothetical protein
MLQSRRVILLVGSQSCQRAARSLGVFLVGGVADAAAGGRRGLHELLVGIVAVLVQQCVECFLVDARFWEFNFCVLSIGAVDDGSAANLGNLLSVSVKHPTSDLTRSDDVLDEQNATREAQRELIKQFNVFQKVVVAGVRVAVLVVVAVDEELHDGLCARAYQVILLCGRCDEWNFADGIELFLLGVECSLAGLGELLYAVVLGLGQQLSQSLSCVGQWSCAIAQEVQYRSKVLSTPKIPR